MNPFRRLSYNIGAKHNKVESTDRINIFRPQPQPSHNLRKMNIDRKKKNTNGQSEKLHRDFINPFQLVFKKQTWKVVFIAMSHNLATNLCVGGNEATPRHPFALNLSIKEEIKLT